MPNILPVPYRPQETKVGCLPACIQMVLAYQGIIYSQTELSRLLGTHPLAGTPHSRIVRLRSLNLRVAYQKATGLNDLSRWLARELPVITFVQARELPHWQGQWFQHAVVVVGVEENVVYLLDPAATAAVIATPGDDFLLAWEEMDLAYAVLAK